MRPDYDVIVIGGGPAGSSAGTVLARHGRRVLLLERERFPRFHIGESLLPALWDLWDRLGVTAAIEAAGFPPKQGVNFGMFNSPNDLVFLTAEFPQYFQRPYVFHVDRAAFDQILLDNASRAGVEVRQGWTVHDVLMAGSRATGVLAGANGDTPAPLSASVVVDASGRHCLLARKMGWRRPDPALNKVSHFAHFRGGYRRDPRETVKIGEVLPESTMTDIHTIDGGWLWYIPLRNGVVSVGAVLDARFAGHLKGPEVRFEHALSGCPRVAQWLEGATRSSEMHTISNISYLNDRFVGDGFVLVGDASMFVDPIFSAGVTLALRGGIFAADQIHEALEEGDVSAERLRPYEERIRHPMGRIFRMIYNWYEVLEKRDPRNIFARSQRMPLLRERLIVLLSGGYDKVDLEAILRAAEEESAGT